MTKTKNERITNLENEVAELKLIVHELRGKKSIEPSTTNTVEDIIEFEGQQYKKVDRKGRKGDVVIFRNNNTRFFTNGVLYKVAANGRPVDNEKEAVLPLYHDGFGRTPETVDVYELIEPKPLTQNQQRAEIIEKAKKFVEQVIERGKNEDAPKVIEGHSYYRNHFFNVDLHVKNNKVTALVFLTNYKGKRLDNKPDLINRAKCSPSDVFNEHIGKAIALGRALGLDVNEFEQAVQPTEFAVGQEIEYTHEIRKGEKRTIESIRGYLIKMVGGRHFNLKWGSSEPVIINDTNAKYEVSNNE